MFASLVLAFALGAFTWTLLEYVIHRWLGHDSRFRPNPFAAEHVRHHSQNYFAPAWKKLGAALLVVGLTFLLARWVVGPELGAAYALGLTTLYLCYELLHWLEHVWEGVGPYARWARRHHFFHHFTDPSLNHGVTTPIWDFVFRTYQKPGVIVVPEKLKMRWLTNAEGEVHEAWQGSFQLRKRRSAAKASA